MNTQARVGIGILVAVVAALVVTLGVVLASNGGSNGGNGGNFGMMGNRDWAGMQEYMRDMMGDDAYEGMLNHMSQQGSSGWSGTQMHEYMRSVMGDDAYNSMADHMRQTWGDDWEDMMGSGMWGMMGWDRYDD